MVRTGSPVGRVVLDGARAVGVESEGTLVEAREVVLAAGAVNSPQLLMRSGVDAPGIGENLHDHVAAGLLVASKQPVTTNVIAPCGSMCVCSRMTGCT